MIDPRAARFKEMNRPLQFVRVRLHGPSGQADYIRELLADEQSALFEDLAKARDAGKQEDSPEITELRANLRHLNEALKDIDNGLIELVGTVKEPGDE